MFSHVPGPQPGLGLGRLGDLACARQPEGEGSFNETVGGSSV